MSSRILPPGTLWRTLRHLRPRQAGHQLLHVVGRAAGRGVRPVPFAGPPPRLVAAGAGPFLPAPPHAAVELRAAEVAAAEVGPVGVGAVEVDAAEPEALAAGLRLRLLNRTVALGDPIDWDHAAEGPLWAFHLHQLDWLRQPDLEPAARTRILLDWVERHRRGIGWQPGPISLRALTWLKLLTTPGALALGPEGRAAPGCDAPRPAPEALGGEPPAAGKAPPGAPAPREPRGASDTEARLLVSLASQLDTLSRHLEHRLLANHYLSNLLALVAGGAALAGAAADAWLGHWPALRDELREQILPDGGHVERSPMYHALLLEHLLDVLGFVGAAAAQGRALPGDLAPTLAEAAARMLGALAVYTHPDGEIALTGDSAFGIAHPPAVLRDYAAARGVEPRPPRRPGVLAGAGYVRLQRGPWSLLASTAGPLPPYQPGHAHCDALAFELCVDGRRVVTDTGVYEYVPGTRRQRARATRAHATFEIDGREQAEIWGAHRVGGRPRVRLVSVGRAGAPRPLAPGAASGPAPGPPLPERLEATCAGWATPQTLHRRVLALEDAGLTVTDTVEGRPPSAVRLFLPLAPGIEARLEDAGDGGVESGDEEGRDRGREGGGDERVDAGPRAGSRAPRGARSGGSGSLPAPCALLRVPEGPVLRVRLPPAARWRVEVGDYYPEFGRCVERAFLVGEAGGTGKPVGPGPFVWRFERVRGGGPTSRPTRGGAR